MTDKIASGTTLTTFRPVIPWQRDALKFIRKDFDYSKASLEVMFSGSVGSAKSILLAHIAVTHALLYENSCVGLFRMSMPDLKDTIYTDILNHIADDLEEGVDYFPQTNRGAIKFRNGSKILSRSFSDKKYTKVRSLRLSLAIFEEFVEFEGEHRKAFDEVKQRIRRLPHVQENAIVCATNPAKTTSHWAYQYFIKGEKKFSSRKVFYSLTFDNPFLDKIYIKQLIEDLDEKQVNSMVYGQWIDIDSERIYYQYESKYNDVVGVEYEINKQLPIYLCWDFNVAEGKPLSVCAFQYVETTDSYHVFDEWIVEGMRTLQSFDEICESGYLEIDTRFYLCGDATGRARDTRGNFSDWDLLYKSFSNHINQKGRKIDFELRVGRSNPPVRKRHILINALCKNHEGKVRLFIYDKASTVREALEKTRPMKGSSFVEDDRDSFQHVGTALGYGVFAHRFSEEKEC